MSNARVSSVTDPSGRFEKKDECITINASVIRYKAYDRETGLEVTWHETILPEDITKNGVDELCQYTERLRKLKHAGMHSILHHWYSAEQNKMFWITESISINSLYTNIASMSRTETVKNRIIVRWFTPVLQVLQYLHAQSPPVIHNRLSLSSIYVKPTSGAIKLMAPLLLSRQKGSMLHIDPQMPPEFLNGEVGTFSDIWRFGLTVLTIVTREIPFSECKTPYELIDKLRNYQPPACLALVSDKMLHDMISSCFRPPIMRASATELLSHPFFSQNFDEEKTGKVSDDGLVVIFSGKPTKSGQSLPKADPVSKI